MFIGLENYIYLFTDAIEAPIFWQSLGNTFYFAVGVPINLIISLLLALLLNRKIRGVGVFRTAFFLPTITSTAAISVVWLWLFHPAQYGLFNSILISLGIPIQSWLRDPLLAMPCLIAMGIWSGMGYNIIIFLAGLQSIPSTYYEAAKIDGANTFSLFRFITWPLLGPTMFYVLTVGIINSLKAFTEIDVMTQGGPLNATNTTAYYLYQNAFQFFQMGKASAIAVLLFLLMLLLTWIQFRFVDRSVHYE
jgi:multiple sugar transport system permease protein